mmetsp:Transcript_28243/g.86310  ORF Transcript_28243/g.86310 Transcript_28243/m.86310 type:complete len:107 (-) Transcript_28243:205-525(-)
MSALLSLSPPPPISLISLLPSHLSRDVLHALDLALWLFGSLALWLFLALWLSLIALLALGRHIRRKHSSAWECGSGFGLFVCKRHTSYPVLRLGGGVTDGFAWCAP